MSNNIRTTFQSFCINSLSSMNRWGSDGDWKEKNLIKKSEGNGKKEHSLAKTFSLIESIHISIEKTGKIPCIILILILNLFSSMSRTCSLHWIRQKQGVFPIWCLIKEETFSFATNLSQAASIYSGKFPEGSRITWPILIWSKINASQLFISHSDTRHWPAILSLDNVDKEVFRWKISIETFIKTSIRSNILNVFEVHRGKLHFRFFLIWDGSDFDDWERCRDRTFDFEHSCPFFRFVFDCFLIIVDFDCLRSLEEWRRRTGVGKVSNDETSRFFLFPKFRQNTPLDCA